MYPLVAVWVRMGLAEMTSLRNHFDRSCKSEAWEGLVKAYGGGEISLLIDWNFCSFIKPN